MKKILFLLLTTVLCVSFLFFCKSTEDIYKTYLVKQTMSDTNVTVTTEFIYNQDYQIVKHKTTANNITNAESEIGYDKNGYQNYQKNVSTSGIVTETFVTNDANGRPLETKRIETYNGKKSETIISYEYTDKNGSYIQTSTDGTITTVTKDEYGNEVARSNNTGQFITYENKYEREQLIETKNTWTIGTQTIITTTKYEYDSQGNKIKETNYDSNGAVISTQAFEYSRNVIFVD
ncbi:MAG: hypothetical protein IJD79_07855 [Clostridia bacterium]|nr:hypothetical protein [Clostridia bacterium]